ncbi:hypothetical protein P153DRAFT_434383 [Dothidotthia symphoricarpi CBS 119687]|uniref:C2H2-type domain-containing protein n=1 Tax=Dothidotthia symphoricarpi CBS 119687 TaxID=1392245 RepID=A0A6A6A3F3_9PLEO|nr:uncharacterized protein P153DRAFT_434383 [Dothidotthia symphoricarpi CBS 119687]KAF2125288.1 hypothetical protein P153DRAFT_434383 [Dothidotthia symphoricarpi CBS 119687]
MGPDTALPLPAEFSNVNDYIESLLKFTTSSWLLQTLCGGVHILDFYTRTPDLYSAILPQSWRDWFEIRDIMDILDLLMREDLQQFDTREGENEHVWRDGPPPPEDLLQYIKDVRKHLLAREFPPRNSDLKPEPPAIARNIALGMKIKKVHEVDHFARYIDRLSAEIAASGKEPITHLVDFGSGQNYLGRALAAPPYSKHIVAVESKQHNIEGAKNMDILAKLVPKPLVMRNKKEYRAKTGKGKQGKKKDRSGMSTPSAVENPGISEEAHDHTECNEDGCPAVPVTNPPTSTQSGHDSSLPDPSPVAADILQDKPTTTDTPPIEQSKPSTTNLQIYTKGHGSVQYVEHIIKDGDLTPVIDQVLDVTRIPADTIPPTSSLTTTPSNLTAIPKPPNVNAMVISLHSCGNLVHHGLRSLILNPHIAAVAMVGCCYNLVTERLGPPTLKLPTLRPNHPRLHSTSTAHDPHGFPMSEHLATYPLPTSPQETGLRLNITARMMAVQAPYNWSHTDSSLFFTRHFYRALLQRIFLDRGLISPPHDAGVSANGHTSNLTWTPPDGLGPGLAPDGTPTPLTIGSLRKFAYSDFPSYVRAATAKIAAPNSFCAVDPVFVQEKMGGLGDEEVRGYERRFAHRKKELSVMWSLMAFSAGVVEAVVVVDRWLWLKEQGEVERAWVEAVFEYGYSPRNLVVVGIKKGDSLGYLPAWLRAYPRLHLPQLPKQTPRQAHSPTFVPTTAAPSTSHVSASRPSHSHPHSHLYHAHGNSPRTEIIPSTVGSFTRLRLARVSNTCVSSMPRTMLGAVRNHPWKKPLDWSLNTTNRGEPSVLFSRSVQAESTSTSVSCNPIPFFISLPVELQLRIIHFCDRATLFQLMHVSSGIRAEAAKLFWSQPDAWYRFEASWLLLGGFPGTNHYNFNFLPYVQRVEVVFEDVANLSCSWIPRLFGEPAVPPLSTEESILDFWQTLQYRLPAATHVVVNDVAVYREQQPLSRELELMLQMCPATLDVSASILRWLEAHDMVERHMHRLQGEVTSVTWWEEVCLAQTHQSILIPPKEFRGPVGAYQRALYTTCLHDYRFYATRFLLIEAHERHHFHQRCEPFNCDALDCNAQFRQPGEYTLHAIQTGHDEKGQGAVPPEEFKAQFKQHQESLARAQEQGGRIALNQIYTDRANKTLEQQQCADQTFLYQLQHDPLYAHGQPVAFCSTWALYYVYMMED